MKIKKHLVSFMEWREWDDYQEYILMSISIHRTRKSVIVCGRLSGEVIEFSPEELRGKTKVIMQQYLATKRR